MSVTLSKKPKPLQLKQTKNAERRGVHWRSAEERRDARRKIDAIRRAAEAERLSMTPVNASVLRSPKLIFGVILLLLILGALLIGRTSKATVAPAPLQVKKAMRGIEVIAQAMTYYRVHTKSWPSQKQGLWALVRNPGVEGWRGPYINAAYKDPWKNPYVYKMPLSPFEAPEVYSCGEDGLPNTSDDIRAEPADFACDEGTWRADNAVESPKDTSK